MTQAALSAVKEAPRLAEGDGTPRRLALGVLDPKVMTLGRNPYAGCLKSTWMFKRSRLQPW